MAEDLEVLPPERPDQDPEEEGGGPVKTFLEHLEDLRWTLIKCVLAILLSFLVCLSGANWVVHVLTWPLERAQQIRLTKNARITFVAGTNVIGHVAVGTAPFLGFPTNQDTVLRLAPLTIGTNEFTAFVPDPSPRPEVAWGTQVQLKNYGPIGGFSVMMQVTMFGGLTLATPFLLFFLGQFILPALHWHERRLVYRIAGFGTGLFLLGVAFCYFLMLIICLSTTVSFSNWLGFAADEWRAEEYISFVCWFMLGMGVAFELPLVLLTLVKIGILDARKLASFRMYWVVIGLVIAAFITPDGNPLNMLLLFLPLHALYEISVLIAKWWERKDARPQALEAGPT